MALAMFGMFGGMLYIIYFLQFDRGYSPLGAGALLVGSALAILVFAPLSAVWTRRYGPRAVSAARFMILAGSFAGMTAASHSTPIALVEVLLVLLGAGSALVIAPTTDIVMASIPRERAGAASAFNSAVRSVGGALGVAVLGSVLSTVYRSRIGDALHELPTHLRDAAGESIGGTQAAVSIVHDTLSDHGVTLLTAASSAFADALHITAGVSVAAAVIALAVVLIWMPRGNTPAEPVPSGAPAGEQA